MQIKASRQALKAAVIYILAAGAWILISDQMVRLLVPNPEARVAVSIFKGLAFVLLSGALLYWMMRRMLRRWERATEQCIEAEIARQAIVDRLHRSEEQLRLIAEASTDGLWDWNLKTGIAHLSPRYWEIIGYCPGEVVADMEFYKRLVYPEDLPIAMATLEEHLAGRSELCVLEYRMVTKAGTVKWIWARGKLVERGADGTPLRMVGTISDITRRKKTETALRESEERYRQLFELDSNAIVLADHATRQILDVNPAGLRLYGYSREEFLQLRLENVSAEPEQSRLSVDRNDSYVPLRWHRKKNGDRFAVEITASDFKHQGRRMKLGAIRDITARLQAEAALRENEAKFRAIFNNNALATAIIEPDSTIAMVNDAYCQVSGYAREDVVGKSWIRTVFPADVERLTEYNRRRRINPQAAPDQYEFRFLHKNGEVRRGQIAVALIQSTGQIIASMLDITERKLADEKLRESEERYRQLFELESDAVVLLDCETHRFVDANQSALRLYGHPREELLQLTVEAVSAEPEKTRAMVGTDDHFIPLRWHHKKDGTRFAVEISTNIITFQGRRTELATIRDITARQQVMEMLEETARQLLEAQRIAGLGSYNFNVATGTWTSSKVLDELFGITEPDFRRDLAGWLQVVHPQDRAEMRRYFLEDVLGKRASFDATYRIVRLHDRQERWVHGLGKLVLDERGQVAQMVGVIQDITDRKRAEEQMHVQFSALTAADNAIVITDRAGTIEWINPAFTKLTGYSADEAVGSSPRLLKSGQHPPAFYANMWATILTGNAWHGELVNQRKDGRPYTEEMTITPVHGANGEISHFVAIKQDVTDRRQFEKRLQQAQKMEAIGTLAGGIAHDFNNILAAMFGYAYLLQQDVDGNPTAQENIGEIIKATGRAKDLVQQILTFSRQREQKPEVVKLDSVVREAIKFLRASLPAQIKIELNLSADAPAVLADPTQIYQVAVNLATNALHAMEGHPGCLTVSLDCFQPDEKFIRSRPELRPIPYARLTVADTGHGMDAKTLERIFEPFFTTKPVGKGTGLGLAVVHGIVQSHAGVITVDSQVGRGTTFCLYFPGRTSAKMASAAANDHVVGGRGQRILLLDDEPALTAVLQRLLERLNYQVAASNSAREVIGWCRDNPAQFDLVITDLTMPEMNGLEVARQIRTLRPDLPVILASGFTAELNRDNLLAAGICDLLEKPISMTSLADLVQRTLAGNGKDAAVR